MSLRIRRTKTDGPKTARHRQAVFRSRSLVSEWIRTLYNITVSHQLSFSEKVHALLVMGCQNYGLQTGILTKVVGDRYEILASTNPEFAARTGLTFDLAESFDGETLRVGGPFGILRASGTPWAAQKSHLVHGTEAYFGTPVIVSGKAFGTLSFSSQAPREKPFTSAEQEFLRLVALWIGGEIEREQGSQQIQKFAAEIALKNQALSEARDQALEASRQKSEFLATISHEIRTPMNAIIGMADLLLETPLNPDQKEYAGVVRDSAQVLLTLLNDVLDLSKIEAGKLDLEIIDFNPVETVERSAELFLPRVREKGLALMTFVDPAIPLLLRGDPNRIAQVLYNLVGNAVKFTQRGEITVRADLLPADLSKFNVRFSIIDSGIGLSSAARSRIFQPFTQAEDSTARKYGGTGLGLSISKRLVEMMGGEIGVDSQEGKGSTFWFSVVFDPSSQWNSNPVSRPVFTGQRALIVDDSPAHNEILGKYMEAWGLRLTTEVSGIKALQTLQAAAQSDDPFNIALIDLRLPEVDGYWLARQVKSLPALNRLVMVGITAYDSQGQGEQALQSGFSGYVTKPVQYLRLRDKLVRLLELPLEDFQAKVDIKRLEQLPEEMAGVAPVLLAEDNPANQKIISIQVQRLGYPVVVVDNGRKVLELLLQTSQQFSALLLDCQMPEVDGFSVVRILRKSELATGRHLPVIAMTANVMEGDRDICLASGMDDYLPKPVKMDVLKEILAQWAQKESSLQPRPEPESLETPQPVLDEQVIQGLRALQVEGEDFLGSITDMFMHEADKLVETMRTAIARGDAAGLRQAAHTLKGSSSGMGASRLSARCLDLETLAREGNLEECPEMLNCLEGDYSLTMQMLQAERGILNGFEDHLSKA